ncbi:MAG: hypothetical protein IJW43_05930 [Clostridia bacterium]|nr:hypothetical protein [Clostridia bacterium]
MKDTIKAKIGYRVKYGKLKNKSIYGFDKIAMVLNGEEILFNAYVRTMEDYKDEKRQNECFIFFEEFTTIKGNRFIYWGDTETGADYLTKIIKEQK